MLISSVAGSGSQWKRLMLRALGPVDLKQQLERKRELVA
jgi:hypothetical protein